MGSVNRRITDATNETTARRESSQALTRGDAGGASAGGNDVGLGQIGTLLRFRSLADGKCLLPSGFGSDAMPMFDACEDAGAVWEVIKGVSADVRALRNLETGACLQVVRGASCCWRPALLPPHTGRPLDHRLPFRLLLPPPTHHRPLSPGSGAARPTRHCSTYSLTDALTHLLTHPPTHPPTDPPTHLLGNSAVASRAVRRRSALALATSVALAAGGSRTVVSSRRASPPRPSSSACRGRR